MKKTVLAIGIIFLLIGASVVSSMDNIVIDIPADRYPLESVYNSEEKFSNNTTWYMFIFYGPEGTGFYAFYPNGTHRFSEWDGDDFFSGGTWTNDGRYLCCLYENGTLYDINPETFDACAIGDGGAGLNGLAYNPMNEKLFGASGKDLYEIDITTGEQTHIGAFGIDDISNMIAIAFDTDGICYGWDVKAPFSGESYLYKINTSTGGATIVGGMGVTLTYAQDGAFEYHTDILYLLAYQMQDPPYGGCLLECDEDTGECYYLGFQQWEATAHAISYELDNQPPVTYITFDPPEPDGCNDWYISNVTVELNAIDNMGVLKTYYRVNGGDWEVYESPFVISEEGDDILIEYYSVDYNGNVEDVKSATIDIDKTPPEMNVEWDVEKIDQGEWEVTFYIEISDATSGTDGLLEIYLNDALHEILSGPGPFSWSCIITEFDISFKFITSDLAGHQAVEIVNSTEINTFPNIKINTYQTNSVGFSHFFERFPLLQKLIQQLIFGQ